MVVTKDFDGSSASRGVEFFMFPVALTTYKYDGCVGCSLIKRYPNRVDIVKKNMHLIQLPRLSRGDVLYDLRGSRICNEKLKVL